MTLASDVVDKTRVTEDEAPEVKLVLVYIAKAQKAIATGTKGIRKSPKCPECDQIVGRADGKHVLYMGNVVVGCEGYWVIDPNKLRIKRPSWVPVNGRVTAR